MNENTDLTSSLLDRARQWDEAALAEVYDTYAPAVYRYVYRQLGQVDGAEEITAETFHRFLVAVKNNRGPKEHLSAWLYRVAHNLVVDYYRDHTAHPEEALNEGADFGEPAQEENVFDRQTQAAQVRTALQKLTPLQQQIITLRFLEDLSYEETAIIVKKSVNAVKALQHRAINRLQALLEELNETEPKGEPS